MELSEKDYYKMFSYHKYLFTFVKELSSGCETGQIQVKRTVTKSLPI